MHSWIMLDMTVSYQNCQPGSRITVLSCKVHIVHTAQTALLFSERCSWTSCRLFTLCRDCFLQAARHAQSEGDIGYTQTSQLPGLKDACIRLPLLCIVQYP